MIFKRIETKIDKIIKSQTEENKRRAKWEDNKEKYLFEILDAKGKLETENKKLLKEQINYKDTIVVKDELIKVLEENEKSQKRTIQELTSEINNLVKYKNERESLIKEKEKLEKELEELKDKGMVLPKRIKKTEAKKQVIGIKTSKVSSSTKKELKKINELREKEEV